MKLRNKARDTPPHYIKAELKAKIGWRNIQNCLVPKFARKSVQSTIICAISWIPKGVSKSEPFVADPDIQEFTTLHSSESENENENEDGEVVDAIAGEEVIANAQASTVCDNIALALKDLQMERYDDEDEGVEIFSSGIGDRYYPSNEMDPYLIDTNDDDDDDELEDMIIYPTDSVIVSARCEKIGDNSFGYLLVWIYEDRNKNLYVHHQIDIEPLPLCTAWLDCPLKRGERGNFLAVGSTLPSIEIWDLDVIEEVMPCVVLGGTDGHMDSVQGLAWNKEYRNILASASADKRVKIWDVVAGKCDITLEHHSDKVQAVAWNHHAPQVLLSGSFDRSVVMKDVRMPSHSGYRWSVTAEVESLAWDPHTEHSFVVSLENGIVNCFDIRTASANSDSTSELSSTFTLHAHDNAVSSVSYNPSAPNLLATGSEDETVKLWDLSNDQPSFVASKTPNVGEIFSVSFSEDNPFVLAIGGSIGNLEVWDTLSDSGISQRYKNYKK